MVRRIQPALVAFALTAPLVLTVAPAAQAAPLADYLGRWSPEKETDRGLLRLRIVLRDGLLRVSARGSGRCGQGRCPWGRASARAYGIGPTAKVLRDTRMIVADVQAKQGARRLLMIRLLKGNRLQVQALVRGAKGTTPYYNVYIMKRRIRDIGDATDGSGGDDRTKPVGDVAAEACTVFEPNLVLALPIRGEWRLIHLGYTIKNFGDRRWLAERAARMIRQYQLRRRCHADVRGYSFEYWRTKAGIPTGAARGEECLRIYPGDAKVRRQGAQWQVSAWDQRYAASRDASEARYILRTLRRFKASHLCRVGRGSQAMVYLRK